MQTWALEESFEAIMAILDVVEQDRRYLSLNPKGEPQLGKRGLYGAVGGRSPAEREHAMLWLLNQSDGTRSLLEVARRSGLNRVHLNSLLKSAVVSSMNKRRTTLNCEPKSCG